jgi:exopolysaccharide biosynthesis protein
MKRSTALIIALTLLLTLALPLLLPSGAMLISRRDQLLDEMWEAEDRIEGGLIDLLFPRAKAEGEAPAALPMDFSPGMPLDPARFSESGYLDSSIELRLETLEQDGVQYRIAYVNIAHPSQLRTATAGQPTSSRVALISSMAEKNNAVIAVNANYMSNDPAKTSFEYRMGERIRARLNRTKDLLIIDQNADFHIFVKSNKDEVTAFQNAGNQIVNAFTFGPALVKDGALLELDPDYGYNPHGKEPRMAIGQTAPLNYVLVHAEGRTQESEGVTHQVLANFMFDIGCQQAFNLDGGNSATLVFNGGYYQNKTRDNERAQSDMIYFASAIQQ